MPCQLEQSLRNHIEELQQAVDQVSSDIQKLVDQSHNLQQRLGAALQLYEAEYGDFASYKETSAPVKVEAGGVSQDLSGLSIADACEAVLRQAQRPVRVVELARILLENGMEMNSRSPERTVATTLYRNTQRFRRTSPGTFALVATSSRTAAQSLGNRTGLVQRAYDILKAAGHPMHVKEIMQQMTAEGAHYNTARPSAMLSGSLRKSKRKFRPCGGDIWALAEWPQS